ncbi:MAG: PSD1 and planctomycete cytochrome C domain-containing protein [Lentisphaeraceae bacterium]|nr:PSD1 and planctomycete cytochrome C domain-containing protein [Lentisphaeraceae bacterium]
MKKCVVVCLLLFSWSAVGVEKVNFSEQIRPLFNRNCTGCHGGVKEAGGLSLLYKESAYGKTDHGIGIVPGKPEESMIYKVITNPPEVFDKKKGKMHRLELMPMEKDPLTKEDVALIKRWIEEGATWEEHWAYTAPVKQSLPKLSTDWVKNRIDYFTYSKMKEHELSPAVEASKGTILRRLSLDLIGVPPTLEELQAFESDQSENAYEKQVDRLLASKHYGERWTSIWLDLARYSDTQGYEKDGERTIYRFRDEVIKAFNKDTPYDQFLIEQMAGDLLPNSTEHQKILTAFHRNTMTNTEGGTDDEEFRVAAIVDRVNTTWEVFMVTSYGCVQCHTHPYDPIKHEEYFEFMAFLNNTVDSDKNNDAPFIKTPDMYQVAKLKSWKDRQAVLKPQVEAAKQEIKTNFSSEFTKLKAQETKVQLAELVFKTMASNTGHKFTQNENGVVDVEKGSDTAIYTLTANADIESLDFVELEVLPVEEFKGSGHAGNFVLSGITLKVDGKSVKISKAEATFEQKGFSIKDSLNLAKKGRGWAIGEGTQTSQTAWFRLQKTVKLKKDSVLSIKLHFESSHKLHTLASFKMKVGSGSLSESDKFVNEFRQKNEADLSDSQKKRLVRHFLKKSKYAKVYDEFTKLSEMITSFKPATTPIMQELPKDKQRVTRVFNRGSWEDLGEVVTPGTPEIFNEFKKEWPRNRLGMAKWMTSVDNPLVPRIAVNRFWEQLFGTGIVDTLEDFGSQGSTPTHPKLLDDLAYRFMHDHKWSMKSFLKELVTSATYKQSSNVTDEKLKKDQFNSYLARGPRFRLSSEQIRDQALSVSGILSSKMFGPSVMPFQPEGVWMTVYNGRKWTLSKDEDKHRRGVYTFWKRTSPYPSMEAFDTPSREICKTRRLRTNTPLQALVTLNDPVYMECAKELGILIKNSSGSLEDKFNFAIQKTLCRSAKKSELLTLKKLYEDSRQEFGKSDEDAWTLVANVLMNLDEFLVKK